MRKGDIAAVVFITSKPVDAFVRGRWEPRFKFPSVTYDSRFEDYYLPVALEASHYPALISRESGFPLFLSQRYLRRTTGRPTRTAISALRALSTIFVVGLIGCRRRALTGIGKPSTLVRPCPVSPVFRPRKNGFEPRG